MGTLLVLTYALAAGLTISGIAASLLELGSGTAAGFRPPFVRRDRLVSSICSAAAAGPYMVGNEALGAWRQGLIGGPALAAWMAVAMAWALAAGVLVVELALAVQLAFS